MIFEFTDIDGNQWMVDLKNILSLVSVLDKMQKEREYVVVFDKPILHQNEVSIPSDEFSRLAAAIRTLCKRT